MPAVPTLREKGMELSSMSVQSGYAPGAVKKHFKIPGGAWSRKIPGINLWPGAHMYMPYTYVYSYTHMYIPIHTCTHPYTHVHTYIHMYANHTQAHTQIHKNTT